MARPLNTCVQLRDHAVSTARLRQSIEDLAYGHIKSGDDQAQPDHDQPNHIIRAGEVVDVAAKPAAEQCADLVEQKDGARKHGHVLESEEGQGGCRPLPAPKRPASIPVTDYEVIARYRPASKTRVQPAWMITKRRSPKPLLGLRVSESGYVPLVLRQKMRHGGE